MRYPSTGSIGELLRIENISIRTVAYFDTCLSKESPQLPAIARNDRVPSYFVFRSLFYLERYPRRYGMDLKPGFRRIGCAENVYRPICVERKAVRARNVWSLYNGVVVLSRDIPSLLFCLKRATIPRLLYFLLFYRASTHGFTREVYASLSQFERRTNVLFVYIHAFVLLFPSDCTVSMLASIILLLHIYS